jgi:3-deoxy-manno-octulosonate cytidylyltransferase (CMP-KDO synthetase)
MNPIVLIPARMGSTRLPDKPLADIGGVPMIVQVWLRAREADIGPVLVATDDRRIVAAVQAAGGRAVMTGAGHPAGTDRIHEAVEAVDPDARHDVVVNLQGDLPTVKPHAVRAALAPLQEAVVAVGTLAAVIVRDAERVDPNVVKVVGTEVAPGRLRALYFTRATAPWGEGTLHHHIGLYAFRRAALRRFVALPPSPLERRERLEQLRALEAGWRIDVEVVDTVPLGVDTPPELERARAMLRTS